MGSKKRTRREGSRLVQNEIIKDGSCIAVPRFIVRQPLTLVYLYSTYNDTMIY